MDIETLKGYYKYASEVKSTPRQQIEFCKDRLTSLLNFTAEAIIAIEAAKKVEPSAKTQKKKPTKTK